MQLLVGFSECTCFVDLDMYICLFVYIRVFIGLFECTQLMAVKNVFFLFI